MPFSMTYLIDWVSLSNSSVLLNSVFLSTYASSQWNFPIRKINLCMTGANSQEKRL